MFGVRWLRLGWRCFGLQVLRFFGSWDDREAMFGDIRPFVINYYLADDTISIGEVCSQPAATRQAT